MKSTLITVTAFIAGNATTVLFGFLLIKKWERDRDQRLAEIKTLREYSNR